MKGGTLYGWDGGLSGHVTCSCGRKTRFFAYDTEHCVTCGGCGTVYQVNYKVAITHAPEETQTGEPQGEPAGGGA